jgi:uncharacterized membrane protein YhaH (DUF805 family)
LPEILISNPDATLHPDTGLTVQCHFCLLKRKRVLHERGQSVGFTEAIISGFQNYVTFSGRARRAEYWWWTLFFILMCVVAGFADSALASSGRLPLVGLIFILVTMLPYLSVAVRRFHDIGRSGWWVLIPLIPLVGTILYLYWMVQPGNTGPNEYGPDPIDQ